MSADYFAVFATREKLFLSTDNLTTHRQIIVKTRAGGDYLPHTPQNPDQPGWYFHPLDGVHTWDIDGSETLVWGNYCNVLGGPVPLQSRLRWAVRRLSLSRSELHWPTKVSAIKLPLTSSGRSTRKHVGCDVGPGFSAE